MGNKDDVKALFSSTSQSSPADNYSSNGSAGDLFKKGGGNSGDSLSQLSTAFYKAVEQAKNDNDPNNPDLIKNIEQKEQAYKDFLIRALASGKIKTGEFQQKEDEIAQALKGEELTKWGDKLQKPFTAAVENAKNATPENSDAANQALDKQKQAYITYLDRIHTAGYIDDKKWNESKQNITTDVTAAADTVVARDLKQANIDLTDKDEASRMLHAVAQMHPEMVPQMVQGGKDGANLFANADQLQQSALKGQIVHTFLTDFNDKIKLPNSDGHMVLAAVDTLNNRKDQTGEADRHAQIVGQAYHDAVGNELPAVLAGNTAPPDPKNVVATPAGQFTEAVKLSPEEIKKLQLTLHAKGHDRNWNAGFKDDADYKTRTQQDTVEAGYIKNGQIDMAAVNKDFEAKYGKGATIEIAEAKARAATPRETLASRETGQPGETHPVKETGSPRGDALGLSSAQLFLVTEAKRLIETTGTGAPNVAGVEIGLTSQEAMKAARVEIAAFQKTLDPATTPLKFEEAVLLAKQIELKAHTSTQTDAPNPGGLHYTYSAANLNPEPTGVKRG